MLIRDQLFSAGFTHDPPPPIVGFSYLSPLSFTQWNFSLIVEEKLEYTPMFYYDI